MQQIQIYCTFYTYTHFLFVSMFPYITIFVIYYIFRTNYIRVQFIDFSVSACVPDTCLQLAQVPSKWMCPYKEDVGCVLIEGTLLHKLLANKARLSNKKHHFVLPYNLHYCLIQWNIVLNPASASTNNYMAMNLQQRKTTLLFSHMIKVKCVSSVARNPSHKGILQYIDLIFLNLNLFNK